MAKIRKIEIENFRSIKSLTWMPAPGINCLIGPGDIGKSTLLDAIDLCLGARRTISISDADFHQLDINQPISITLTLGDLEDCFKNIENYGLYLQSFNDEDGVIHEEPRRDLETVLCLNLTVTSDLEPEWKLISERATELGLSRNIVWKDRVVLAPMRLGNYENTNFSWSKGSVLNKLSDEPISASDLLAQVARDARDKFCSYTEGQLTDSLNIVLRAAQELGVDIGQSAKAMLDARAVSFTSGAISLHNNDGIPLRNLGTGSSRLLIAGLNKVSSEISKVILVDEVEHGLEPHRLVRLLNAIGAKEKEPLSQVFITTHSPVALRELSGHQLFVVRRNIDGHKVKCVGMADEMQGAIRSDPESFLSSTVIVCEGASEVGFIRGIDECRVFDGELSLGAKGVSYVDAGGGSAKNCLDRAMIYLKLGYKVIAFLDSDLPFPPEFAEDFKSRGGTFIAWREGRNIENELFLSLPNEAIDLLIERAIQLKDRQTVDNHIREASGNYSLEAVAKEREDAGGYSEELRNILAKASGIGKRGASWFKSISKMEGVSKDIVYPYLDDADSEFFEIVNRIFVQAYESARD